LKRTTAARRLAKLKEDGLVTEEEFERAGEVVRSWPKRTLPPT
jgi:hypothetical protein